MQGGERLPSAVARVDPHLAGAPIWPQANHGSFPEAYGHRSDSCESEGVTEKLKSGCNCNSEPAKHSITSCIRPSRLVSYQLRPVRGAALLTED
jgi:hypothetical protein